MATHSYRGAPRPHPIHGILSAYPLAFFTGALGTDIVYSQSANMMWANFSAWLIAAGIAFGVLASIAGIIDAIVERGRRRRGEPRPWLHSPLTAAMMIAALFNAFVHSRDAWTSVVPTGIILSAVTTLLALASSWLGYSLQSRRTVN